MIPGRFQDSTLNNLITETQTTDFTELLFYPNLIIQSQEVDLMQVKWKTLITQVLVWMLLEFILNLLGLDDLANYDEFLSHVRSSTLMSAQTFNVVM